MSNTTGKGGGKRTGGPDEHSADPDNAKTEPTLPLAHQQLIGRRLRQMFDEVVQQPVPDRFLELLEQLEQPKQQRADEDKAE